MSLILDALNRSREDANPVPGLTTHHSVEPVAVNRRQYLLWVALTAAVIVIAWLFMDRYSAPQSSTSTVGGAVGGASEIREEAVVAAQAAPSIAESLAPAAEIITPAVVNQAQATVASATGLEKSPPLGEDLSNEMVERRASTVIAQSDLLLSSAPPANDAVAQLYANPDIAEEPVTRNTQRRSAGSVESADEPIDVDAIIKLAREEVKNAGLIDNSVPLLMDLSQQFKDTVPSVYYLRHDYSSDVSRSTVVLNSKTLSVGGSPATGMKVEEILPDSVVLNYQGTQFRLRGLNSWINL